VVVWKGSVTMKKTRLLLALVALPLAGCDAFTPHYPQTTGLLGIEATSLVMTGKTATDHLFSMTTKQDCNVLRAKDGGKYCESRNPPVDQPEVFCYRTLGAVSCYKEMDPYGDSIQPIGLDAYQRAEAKRQEKLQR
jgi:hypothetical protein